MLYVQYIVLLKETFMTNQTVGLYLHLCIPFFSSLLFRPISTLKRTVSQVAVSNPEQMCMYHEHVMIHHVFMPVAITHDT